MELLYFIRINDGWKQVSHEEYNAFDGEKEKRRMNNLEKAQTIIKDNFEAGDCGLYNTRNIVGDDMTTIYNKGGLKIDICYRWSYFEVFGLPASQFDELLSYYNYLKTFG